MVRVPLHRSATNRRRYGVGARQGGQPTTVGTTASSSARSLPSAKPITAGSGARLDRAQAFDRRVTYEPCGCGLLAAQSGVPEVGGDHFSDGVVGSRVVLPFAR